MEGVGAAEKDPIMRFTRFPRGEQPSPRRVRPLSGPYGPRRRYRLLSRARYPFTPEARKNLWFPILIAHASQLLDEPVALRPFHHGFPLAAPEAVAGVLPTSREINREPSTETQRRRLLS
jgi:hypothetical protein